MKVHAHCLMGNHYHLLIKTPLSNLARCMRHVNGVYTQRYNRLKNTDGPLFRGRSKTVLVEKDLRKLALSGLKKKAKELLDIVSENPYQNPPPYEKLVGDLSGPYSRRINIQHRLVYQILEDEKIVKVLRLWAHYE